MTDTITLKSTRRDLSLNCLKYIAVVAMLIDHIAFAFVPNGTLPAILMHIIGRITGLTMFFAAVEGYHHTRNLSRYLLRLAVFAGVSWIPFLYFHYGGLPEGISYMRPNVIYTIFCGVLAVSIRRSERLKNPVLKTLLILALVILCVPADWGPPGVMIILVFDFFYGNFQQQAFAYCLIVLCQMDVLSLITRPFFSLFYDGVFYFDREFYAYFMENTGAFLPLILLCFYKGRHGARNRFAKWFFYFFYPLHLLLLGFLQTL